MKTLLARLFLVSCAMLVFSFSRAQENWPKVITASDGTILKVYQPQPETFKGNTLQFRSAISVTSSGSTEPVFGTFWGTSKVETDRDNRQVAVNSLDVTSIKIPAITDQDKIDLIDQTLEDQFPQAAGSISQDELLTSLDQNAEQEKLSQNINTTAPKIIFTTQPSMLVIIDGEPKMQRNPDWNLDAVINSPFTILKNDDDQFYLFGSKHWYVAKQATGPYSFTGDYVPENIGKIGQELAAKSANNSSNNSNQTDQTATTTADPNAVANIVVSTVPAELIQSKGEPNFTPIEGTNLLYVKNSDNDIFMNTNSQEYFVLISGRWYRSHDLNSNTWQFTPSDHLPADFARIPEGSVKDNVLASVAGTNAAKEAVMDAQIPQTAKVNRHTATTTVTYNGQPKFTDVEGTHLQYAVNTSSTVLRSPDGRFYALDNGVWFVSDDARGPWVVSTDRPAEVDEIPPSSPAYNSKYVYVYDVNPDYVYMGYTPGYLNSYIYGPTVVYGTGFYYNPWYGGYYYPRPWSWGFGYGYTPFYGWGFGFGYSAAWFNIGFGWGGYWGGGWWGPRVYHPCYWGGWHGGPRPYGFYGKGYGYAGGYHVNYNNNIYRNRGGIVTRNSRPASANQMAMNRTNGARPGGGSYSPGTNSSNRPAGGNVRPEGAAGRPSNNVFSDRQGNVYQRGQQGQWQQRSNRQWAPVSNSRPEVIQNLNRQQVMRDRGEMRTQNFERARVSAPSGGGGRPSGGGGRSSGGGGHSGGGGRR
jgi:hypothetical protein